MDEESLWVVGARFSASHSRHRDVPANWSAIVIPLLFAAAISTGGPRPREPQERAGLVLYIGKESNSLEDVEAGLVHSEQSVYTE